MEKMAFVFQFGKSSEPSHSDTRWESGRFGFLSQPDLNPGGRI
jgi:hypothetical protein